MKATVMESKNGTSIILTEEGTFIKIAGTYAIGEVIEYQESKRSSARSMRPAARFAIAACIAAVLCVGGIGYYHTAAYAAVTIGTNETVTYHLNRKNQVVGIETSGEHAKELKEELTKEGIRGQSLSDAITQTKPILRDKYDDDASKYSVTAKNHTRKKELERSIRQEMDGSQNVQQESDAKKADGRKQKASGSKQSNTENQAATGSKKAEAEKQAAAGSNDSNAKKQKSADSHNSNAEKKKTGSGKPEAGKQQDADRRNTDTSGQSNTDSENSDHNKKEP